MPMRLTMRLITPFSCDFKDGSTTSFAHEAQFVGFNGEAANPVEIVLLNNGL